MACLLAALGLIAVGLVVGSLGEDEGRHVFATPVVFYTAGPEAPDLAPLESGR